jgi:LmbE family N-acetylglucosaminyl deacetylase
MQDFHFSQAGAELDVPDAQPLPGALSRSSMLGVGAHPDDLEFMAYFPILACHQKSGQWFSGVTCCDGAPGAIGSAWTVEERAEEQRRAAKIGGYAAQFQLKHPSAQVKDPKNQDLAADLRQILEACRPELVYTHNLADKHDTHVAVTLKLLAAIRSLPKGSRPKKLVGCEGWRDLDWMDDADKLAMDVGGDDALAEALMGAYQSQLKAKRYDLATLGRRRAHATYFQSHAADQAQALTFGMDLTPLILDDSLDPWALLAGHLRKFEADMKGRILKLKGA